MTHKGLAGWCGSDKNGCRDKEIIRRFENGEWQNGQFPVNAFIRVFGADKAMEEKRKFLGVDMTKDEQLKSPPVVKSPPRITDPDGLLDRKLPAWLADVKEQITGALECVGQAERDLEVAKADLKASLEKALTRLG